MRLLIINDSGIRGGGTEVRIKLLTEESLKRKYFEEMHLLEHNTSNSPNLDGLNVHKCDTKTSGKIVENIILQNKIDIVQIHNLSLISVRPIIAAQKLNKSVIFSAHDYWGFCGRRNKLFKNKKPCKGPCLLRCSSCMGFISYINTLKNKHYLNKCDVGIAPSEFVIKQYEKNNILKGKWKKVEPWIDLSKFYPDKSIKRDKSVLFVGSSSYHKGTDLLAYALKDIKQEFPEIILRFIGDGQEENGDNRKRIEKILQKTGTSENVEFLGYKTPDELRYEYNRAGVFVCCSIWDEVFGQVWAQAAACKCPVLVTDSGSMPELVSNTNNVVEKNPKLIANKIIKMLKNKDFENLKELENRTKLFSVPNATTKLIEIYETVINKQHSSG